MSINKARIGRFDAVVVDHDLGSTRDDGSGKDFIHIRFAFTDSDGEEAQIVARLWLTEAAIASQYGTTASLGALGWDPDEKGWAVEELARKTIENPGGGVLIGAKASITTELDTWEGKTRLVVQWINQPGGGLRNRAQDAPGGVGAFGERVRALVRGEGAPTRSAGRTAPQAAPAFIPEDDDIPF